jgi:hypothetical protein
MAVQDVTTIPLHLPSAEAQALAQFCKRVTFETCVDHASAFTAYGGRAEADVISSGIGTLRSALAEAGFSPR